MHSTTVTHPHPAQSVTVLPHLPHRINLPDLLHGHTEYHRRPGLRIGSACNCTTYLILRLGHLEDMTSLVPPPPPSHPRLHVIVDTLSLILDSASHSPCSSSSWLSCCSHASFTGAVLASRRIGYGALSPAFRWKVKALSSPSSESLTPFSWCKTRGEEAGQYQGA